MGLGWCLEDRRYRTGYFFCSVVLVEGLEEGSGALWSMILLLLCRMWLWYVVRDVTYLVGKEKI